MQVQ